MTRIRQRVFLPRTVMAAASAPIASVGKTNDISRFSFETYLT